MTRIYLFVLFLLDAAVLTVAFPQSTRTSNNRIVYRNGNNKLGTTRSLRIYPDKEGGFIFNKCEEDEIIESSRKDQQSNRRIFMASALIAGGALIDLGDASAQAAVASDNSPPTTTTATYEVSLPWKQDPVNKRFGVTVGDAEKAGYNVAFITYLARFLLNFDPNCQRWWFSTKIPKNAKPRDIEQLRLDQFAAFSASVEVGLLKYGNKPDGPRQLLEDMVQRYGKAPDKISDTEGDVPLPPSSTEGENFQNDPRTARSARRQIALLFGLLENVQPVKEITKLLASVDNGSVTSVIMINETLSGYEIGNPPEVTIPPPEAGELYVAAECSAILKPTGKILRIDVIDAGSGYSEPPIITISYGSSRGAAATTTTAETTETPAKSQAKITSKGPNKGSIESIKLLDTGTGFMNEESIQIQVSRPQLEKGRIAVLAPVLDMAIDGIDISNGGTGYAVEKPLKIFVELPANDRSLRQVGVASACAEKTSFTAFRRESDKKQIFELEEQFETKYNMKPPISSGTISGIDSELPPLPFWNGGKSSSAELLRLLPAGIGLEYDSNLKRYALAADGDFLGKYPAVVQQSTNRPIGYEYGPRGRAPIERVMKLGMVQYVRFALSGAICSSGVHLALTPLDVVKTKVQVDPVKYPKIGSAFGTVWNDEGPSTLFTGWLPTVLGNFAGGGTLYVVTEFIRRSLTEAAGIDALSLEVPIILVAAAIASSLGAMLICPFDAVRIRTVAQPEYANNSIAVLERMLKEEGFGSLVNAIPVFLARNVPYAMVKFLVFDLLTERLYLLFPAAQEELKLSLLVSLAGGIVAGVAAAIISNPADAVISELKKAKSDISPLEAVNNMRERAGSAAFFVGLPLRMLFYSLNASLNFVVYDSVRFLLGVGGDDLKLYLDVLGGALNDNSFIP